MNMPVRYSQALLLAPRNSFHTKTPQSVPTFLVDGAVAGTWRYQRGKVELKPFEALGRADRDELEQEGRRLATFHV